MNNVALIMKYALKNNLRMKATAIISLSIIIICVVGVIILLAALIIGPEMKKAVPDQDVLNNNLGLILFSASFMSVGIYASVFSYQSITREKARGIVQAMLATPLEPFDIWLGKSLAVFLPGFILAVVMTLGAFLVINYVYFVDKVGFVGTAWMFVSSFILCPVMYLAVVLLNHVVGLGGKPVTANMINQIFLPVMANIMIQLAVRTSLDASSWLFALILLGTTCIAGICTYSLRQRLNTETIIMSLKG
jgi:ABC-2 type transport system permease protein